MNAHDVLVPSTPLSPNVSITVPLKNTSNASSPLVPKAKSEFNGFSTVGSTPKNSRNPSFLLRYKNWPMFSEPSPKV
eukprot:scaffold88891_cov55-Phaeocystis_antarctica.AAC.8